MSRYRHLPVWKTAMDLAVHLEHAVRRFPRYHKYTLGSELRQAAQRICRLVARANDARAEARLRALDELVLAVEEMKTLMAYPGLGRCLEYRAEQLPALRRRLKRAGRSHVLAAQTGHHKTGFRRRETVLLWRPAQPFPNRPERGVS